MLKASGRPALNALPPLEAREMFRRGRLVTQPDLPQVDRVYERAAAGPRGPIPLRVYRGAGTADMGPLPVHVYYHGGGWVIGDLDSHDWICRKIANAAQCAVVSVDYRMAPEHVFPAAFDDAHAAVGWVAETRAPSGSTRRGSRSAATARAGTWPPPWRSPRATEAGPGCAPRSSSIRRPTSR